MAIEVIYKNKRYPTISSCLKEYGLKINTFTVYRRRCLPGVDINTALDVYIGKHLNRQASARELEAKVSSVLEQDTGIKG